MNCDTGISVDTNDSETLMRQAHLTADVYMRAAAERIDVLFGEKFSDKHPELVAAFMKTAAQDFHTAAMLSGFQKLQSGLGGIADALRDDVHRTDHPLMSETLDGISNGLQAVASSIEALRT